MRLAGLLAWENGWVTAVSVTVILVGAVVGLWDTVLVPVVDRRRQIERDADRFRSVLLVKPCVVSEADPYELGVFDSEFARAVSGQPLPPYVPRTIDDRLDVAFEEERLQLTQRLVVVRGDPKAGKTRTLWEAINRHAADRLLLALRLPLPGDPTAPEHKPIETVLGLSIPINGRAVVWIDDSHEHLEFGLTANNLRRLTDKSPYVIVAMTFHNSELEGIKHFDRPLERLLRAASDGLVLPNRLSNEEVGNARSQYPALAGDEQLAWLPEWFAAVNLLRDRYTDNQHSQPAGIAAVHAASDWQRMGMPPVIPPDELRQLTQIALSEVALPHRLTDEEFERAINWATEPVAARASLLLPVEGDTQPS